MNTHQILWEIVSKAVRRQVDNLNLNTHGQEHIYLDLNEDGHTLTLSTTEWAAEIRIDEATVFTPDR